MDADSKKLTPEEIEDLAITGAELPELAPAETLLFLMFRALYDFAARNDMPRAQGKREKQKILQAYKTYVWQVKLIQHHAKTEMLTERARRQYCLNPSIETADKLLEAINNAKRRIPKPKIESYSGKEDKDHEKSDYMAGEYL